MTATLISVRDVVIETLGLQDRSETITESTLLFGALPELDSLAIVELITVIEDRFGIVMDDEDITGETFESVGSLAAYVERQQG